MSRKNKVRFIKRTYIDWGKLHELIGHQYNYVAIDLVGDDIYPAGVPVAFNRQPRFEKGRWIRSFDSNVNMFMDIPMLVPKEAVIGPLPLAEQSLVRSGE